MMKIFKAIMLGCSLLATIVPFQSQAWLIQKPPYVGPGDLVPYSAWYGLRGYSAAKAIIGTTKMVRLRHASTSELCDVLVSQTGGIGLTTNCTSTGAGKTVNTFCTTPSGGCRVQTWYDQTGNLACGGATCDLVQNTALRQYGMGNATGLASIVINPVGGSEDMTSANSFTPSAAILSVSMVGDRTFGFALGGKYFSGFGTNNGIECNTSANQMKLVGGAGGSVILTAADSTYHAVNGVINGGSSVAMVDGVDTTGTASASTSGAAPNSFVAISNGCLFNLREIGFINNYAFTPGERAAINASMRTYWAF